MIEDYDPADDRYLNNPRYEPEFDPEGDDGPPLYVERYRADIRAYERRCNAVQMQRDGIHL